MKVNIEDIQDSFIIGYNAYEDSIREYELVDDLFHNRQWTDEQLAILGERGSPKETFNIIKMFTRLLQGYYAKTTNSFKAKATNYEDVGTEALLSKILNQVQYENNYRTILAKITTNAILSGLFLGYVQVLRDETVDEFNRPHNNIDVDYVPPNEVILDPKSKREDYSDARFFHRYRWLSREEVIKLFGKRVVSTLDPYDDTIHTVNKFNKYIERHFQGKYSIWENYLIVHSIIEDEKGATWSIFWHGDRIIRKTKIATKGVKSPYIVIKLMDSEKPEFYSVMREAIEPQLAINQAIVQIQLMANTNKAMVDESVTNLDEFTQAFNRVNAVVRVPSLNGVQIINLSSDIRNQYMIIDKALERIQNVLRINDSFLGNSFASDSGRKVKLQQNSATMSLSYIDDRLELFQKVLGTNMMHLIKQYYTSHRVMRINGLHDEDDEWVEINRPLRDANGRMFFEENIDPDSGEPTKDANGSIELVPVNVIGTDLQFTNATIHIESTNHADEDEKNQILIETMLGGVIGNSLLAVNPSAFFNIASMSLREMKTKNSMLIAKELKRTAEMLQPQPQKQEEFSGGGGQLGTPKSQSNKLPQNTNEGM